MQNGVIAQLRASRTHSTAGLNLQILVPLEEQDGGTVQKINKSVVRHTRNFPVPYEWISGSCQKDNLPPNIGHRMNLPFSSSILIPTLVSKHQLLNASYYNQSPELESPQPSRSLPSARLIQPHAESAPHALLISSVSEEMWITAIQPTALESLKIIVKEVSPG